MVFAANKEEQFSQGNATKLRRNSLRDVQNLKKQWMRDLSLRASVRNYSGTSRKS